MRKPSGAAFRWGAPIALAVVAIVALLAGPVLGGPVTTSSLKKRVNATELRLSGEKETGNTFDLNDPSSLMASLTLKGGNYVINATYTLLKDTGGLAVECQLRAGGRHDTDNFFGGGGQIQQGSAMSVTAHVNGGQKAQVRCDDGSAATTSKIQNLEITATKLPKITTKTVAP